jgi:hypothetical protein
MQVSVNFKRCSSLLLQRFYFSCGIAFLSLWLGCYREDPHGILRVSALNKGSFEIYHIASESPFQLVAEEIGNYNSDISLAVGSYLILCDCSSEVVVIHPNLSKHLVAHDVTFTPPMEPTGDDKFTIQCTQHEKTQTRQKLVNQFALKVLNGKRDVLVGMIPFKLDLDFPKKEPAVPQTLNYKLSSLQVFDYPDMKEKIRYFISPLSDQLSVTEFQDLGKKLFLLPGDYRVELNGTQTNVSLKAEESFTIEPAFVKVSTPETVDLKSSSNISGNPVYVEINGGHWLNLNETYPVLPGTAKLRLMGSESEHSFDLVSGQLVDKLARSVTVKLDCPPWDWNCLGSKKVFLFGKEQTYPFAKGDSDVPLLFFEEEAFVSLEGTRDIRYQIATGKADTVLESGEVKLKPTHEFKQGLITDLVRIETVQKPFEGHSLDLILDEESRLMLIHGSFNLVQYISSTTVETDRRKISQHFAVKSNSYQELNFTVYVSEKKLKQIKTAEAAKKARAQKNLRTRYSRNAQPPAPLRFQ